MSKRVVEHTGSQTAAGLRHVHRADDTAPPPELLRAQQAVGNRTVVQRLARGRSSAGDVRGAAAGGVRGSGQPLPHLDRLQRAFAPHDLGRVRAHTDDGAARAALSIGARAYAFGDRLAFAEASPGLDVVAHEVAHTLQQRGGIRLAGGVGAAGDVHERQADAIAAAVVRGDRVGDLLRPATGGPAAAGVQRMNVDSTTAGAIKKRIAARGGRAVGSSIDDRYYSFESDQGLAAIGVASMAADPKFEAEAERFEARIGSLAYNHSRSHAVAQAASTKVLKYIDAKYADSVDKVKAIETELASFGIDRPDWSGSVGKNAEAIRSVLKSGSISEQVAHVESFVCNVLSVDLMEDRSDWRKHAGTAGFDEAALDAAQQRVEGTGDRYLAYDLPEGGASAIQWHTRIGVGALKRDAGADRPLESLPLHPSSVKQRGVETTSSSTTTRKRKQIESSFPLGIGVELGKEEARFQEEATGGRDRVLWEEGARIYALNELDTWVHAQREFSLPLAAGASSTAARVMQAFKFLAVGPPDDVRLAAIGALLPPRHHTLVEVMFAAKPFGATPYREGPMMYHDLAPLTESEIRGVAQFYPDETIDSDYSHLEKEDESVLDEEVAPKLSVEPVVDTETEVESSAPKQGSNLLTSLLSGSSLAGLAKRPKKGPKKGPKVYEVPTEEQETLADVSTRTRLPETAPAFTHTRATLSEAGISNLFKKRNSAQARMLRAIDLYHKLPATDTMGRLRALAAVGDEAAHWLGKHGGKYSVHWASTQKKFKDVRDDAAKVVAYYEDQYLLDLAEDRMLADSHHAYQGIDLVRRSGGKYVGEAERLIKTHGLTEAECAAIATYVGPAYKFINPGLEKDSERMQGRLMGFVSETASSFGSTTLENKHAAGKARRKLRGLRNKKVGAMDEAQRHAIVAVLGLDKLPPYTGMVYAGGALTKDEALQRFKTGEVQTRASFASTTRDKLTASMFAASKWTDINDAYEADPRPGKEPFAYILNYRSKTGRQIEALSHKPEEQEVLFAPGSKLRIVRGAADARRDPDQRKHFFIDAEEIV